VSETVSEKTVGALTSCTPPALRGVSAVAAAVAWRAWSSGIEGTLTDFFLGGITAVDYLASCTCASSNPWTSLRTCHSLCKLSPSVDATDTQAFNLRQVKRIFST
jgi:hypothetical protein